MTPEHKAELTGDIQRGDDSDHDRLAASGVLNKPFEDGGSAYPFVCQDISRYQVHEPGMALRDYFAGQAMLGMISNPGIKAGVENEIVAKVAYNMADAMIAARKKPSNS